METESTEAMANEKKGWPRTDAILPYIIVFLGGGALIVGAFLPWVQEATGFESYPPSGIEYRTGLGALAGNIGVITFLIGLLTFVGLFKFAFKIPQKLYLGSLAIASLLLMIGYIAENDSSEFDFGVWITLAGGIVLTLGLLINFLKDKSINVGGSSGQINKCNLWNTGGLAIPAIVAIFVLPYNSELSTIEGTSNNDEFGIMSIFIVVLLFLILALCATSKSSVKPPASLFLLLSTSLLVISSPFVFRIFGEEMSSGAVAANYVVFIVAIFISTIAVRAIRESES